jgi:hypothetical protein
MSSCCFSYCYCDVTIDLNIVECRCLEKPEWCLHVFVQEFVNPWSWCRCFHSSQCYIWIWVVAPCRLESVATAGCSLAGPRLATRRHCPFQDIALPLPVPYFLLRISCYLFNFFLYFPSVFSHHAHSASRCPLTTRQSSGSLVRARPIPLFFPTSKAVISPSPIGSLALVLSWPSPLVRPSFCLD